MTDLITKKPMKLGTVNIPVGTEIGKLPENIISELVTRGLVDRTKELPKAEKLHKEKKSETGI